MRSYICLLTQFCVLHLEYRCTVCNIVLSQCSPEQLSQNTHITRIFQISFYFACLFLFFFFVLFLISSSEYHISLICVVAKNLNGFSSLKNLKSYIQHYSENMHSSCQNNIARSLLSIYLS